MDSSLSPSTPDCKQTSSLVCWIRTCLFLPLFFGTLLFFHPLQWLASLVGYSAHKSILDAMNFCILQCLRVSGARIAISGLEKLPAGRPFVLVSNHQSMFDIPLIIWTLRDRHPKFIAKKELGRGIPSISFALRTMGSVLIDRGNPAEAMVAIRKFALRCKADGFSPCIFPEGTRARDGVLKRFKTAGVLGLLEELPEYPVVVAVLKNSWQLVRYNLWPVPSPLVLEFQILDFHEKAIHEESSVRAWENRIRSALGHQRLEE